MKLTKTKQKFALRTLLSLLMLTVLIINALPLTASATTSPYKNSGVTWTMLDADHTKLDGDGTVYEKVDLPLGCTSFPMASLYVYNKSVREYGTDYNYIGNVYSFEKNGYLLQVPLYDGNTVFYCRSEMLKGLKDYFNGATGQYVLRYPKYEASQFNTNDRYYDMSNDFASELFAISSSGNGKVYPVSDLKDLDLWELRLQDKSGLLTTLYGMIYALPDGDYGFVDYKTLDNSHFDAEGNFSYRQGEVTVYSLGSDFPDKMKTGVDGKKDYTMRASYTYEEAEYPDSDDNDDLNDTAIVLFWICFVFLGYLLPIAPLTVGIVFVNSKKMSHPKRWYFVVALSVAWLILSVTLTVLLLL